jgi:hypothetical protein
MTESEFEQAFGAPPRKDDLHRVNCTEVGKFGHYQCGICLSHQSPRFLCGCICTNPIDSAIVKQRLDEFMEWCRVRNVEPIIVSEER